MSKRTFLLIVGVFVLLMAIAGGYTYYQINFAPLSEEDRAAAEESFMQISDKGDVDTAIVLAEKISARNPNEVSVLLNQVYAYLDKGSLDFVEKEYADKAIVVIEKILSIDPKNSEAHRFLGYAYEIKEEYENAIKAYDRAIEFGPTNDQAYLARGHMYDLSGDLEKAGADYIKAYSISSKNPATAMNLARYYYSKNDFPNTIKFAEEAAANGTKARLIATAHDLAGLAYVDIQDYDKAWVAFDAAVKADPNYEKPYLFRAYVNYLRDTKADGKLTISQAQEINKDINKALTIYPGYADAYVQKAEVSIALGDFATAKSEYQKAYAMIDGDITLTAYDKADMKNEITIELKKYE